MGAFWNCHQEPFVSCASRNKRFAFVARTGGPEGLHGRVSVGFALDPTVVDLWPLYGLPNGFDGTQKLKSPMWPKLSLARSSSQDRARCGSGWKGGWEAGGQTEGKQWASGRLAMSRFLDAY